jgi:probable HAF family extracellular repeat protein
MLVRRLSNRHLAAALAAILGTASLGATAGTPLYHLTVLSVPDATDVTAKDINEAGQIVGTYFDADFARHAVLWDAQGWHELALPPPTSAGGGVDGIAYAINNNGQIVGTSDDFEVPTRGLLWNAATPGTYSVLDETATGSVSPNDINDDGVVVGGFGFPSRAFVWTAADGLVDYGIQDPNVEDQQARWSAINAAGTIIGYWNQHVSNIHATIGTVGTPAVLGMGGLSDEFPTNAVGLNDAGVAVGLGLSETVADLVPVIFASDGSFTEIPGATLDQPDGSAIAINTGGVIVGTAGIGTANGPVPGLQAWVYRDGTAYDLYTVVDDTAGFARFSNAVAINDAGVIVGTGKLADDSTASFVLTPIQADAVFANGFDPQE